MSFKLDFIERKHGFRLETHNGVEYAVLPDGLLIIFNLQDIEAILNKHYPKGNKVWFFNESKDREIAEKRGDRVYCNPQVLWRHKEELTISIRKDRPHDSSGLVAIGNPDRASISDPAKK